VIRGQVAGLAVVVVAATMGLAACGGAGRTPHVATLGQGSGSHGSGGGNSTTTGSGNPTQLLDEWAACMRTHGDPDQTDPTIDSDKDIEITMENVSASLSNEVHAGGGPCSNYLDAASLALNGGQPQPTDNPVLDDKFAACMRANGYPNWPDTVGGETNFQGTGIDPTSAAVQNATNTCDKKVGMPEYNNGAGPGGTIQVQSCTPPPGKQCPAGGPGSGGAGGSVPVSSSPSGSGANG
jgi:hypothetical protein